MYFDGSDVDLTTGGEGVDAVSVDSAGDLYLSTTGNFTAGGVSGADEEHELGLILYKARMGQPQAPELMALLEDPENHRRLQGAEIELHKDQTKKELYAQKEELFFAIGEKSHDADLTEKGRNFLNPDDPDAFTLPDIVTTYQEIDESKDLDAEGRTKAKEEAQSAYEAKNERIHVITQLLKAYGLYTRDKDYIVQENRVIIVDEHTGRPMEGRRWSDGLHQAVEAKERVKIERENQTLATVTFQNYFRKYDKLSGMTGTADTEAPEFSKIYKLDVMVAPTNRELVRIEEPDTIYRTEKEKFDAIAEDVTEKQTLGRPVLVGTVSIEKSERLSGLLKRRGVKHVVLNAKYHAQEAEIVAQAGRRGTVTIATNMAGRGTDILLGGNAEYMSRQQSLAEEVAERLPKEEAKFVDDDQFVYFYHIDNFYRVPSADWMRISAQFASQTDTEHEEVVEAGGLHIIGTERHESRRIDNQLRGRAGRQGDPGSSRFYLSLEDDLMRIFGSDRISGLMERLGMEEGVPIEAGMVTKAIARAQKQVEAQHFAIRKHLLEYDDVMNKQRENFYTLRRELLDGQVHVSEDEIVDSRRYLLTLAEDIVDDTVELHCGKDIDPEEWDTDALAKSVGEITGLAGDTVAAFDLDDKNPDEMHDALWTAVKARYEEKEQTVDRDTLRRVERDVMLQIADAQWKDHLYSLDHLKDGIGLRAHAQKDPLVEYKRESFELFKEMKERTDTEMVRYLWRLRPVVQGDSTKSVGPAPRQRTPITLNNPSAGASVFSGTPNSGRPQPARTGGDDAKVRTMRRDTPKVGRNSPCPCGSGKKYKKCHGA